MTREREINARKENAKYEGWLVDINNNRRSTNRIGSNDLSNALEMAKRSVLIKKLISGNQKRKSLEDEISMAPKMKKVQIRCRKYVDGSRKKNKCPREFSTEEARREHEKAHTSPDFHSLD